MLHLSSCVFDSCCRDRDVISLVANIIKVAGHRGEVSVPPHPCEALLAPTAAHRLATRSAPPVRHNSRRTLSPSSAHGYLHQPRQEQPQCLLQGGRCQSHLH